MLKVTTLCCALLLAASAGTAGTLQTLHSFGGSGGVGPQGGLTLVGSVLYGTTYDDGENGGGTLFRFDPGSNVLTTLYSFVHLGSNGSGPVGTLLVSGSKLFGVTEVGGLTACSDGCGTVFEYNITTQKLVVLHQFTGGPDGARPEGRLRYDATKKVLYGTAALGGNTTDCSSLGCGTVFSLVVATKAFTTLHQFTSSDQGGAIPEAGVTVDAAGLLYGTASISGQHGSGTVFVLDPGTQAYRSLHDFDYHVDGNNPMSDLLPRQGLLYGTTASGGPTSAADGTIYSYDPPTGAFATVYSLDGAHDGQGPHGPLLAGQHNLLYGTAEQGGTSGVGTVWSLNMATGHFAVVYTFTGDTDGAIPASGVVQDSTGALYGVTSYSNGVLFKIAP